MATSSKPTPGVAKIPLTKGQFALVDEGDLPWISSVKWHVCNGYAVHSARSAASQHKSVRMHRIILDAPADMEVDHIDGNRLNNCRSNLRLCSSKQNTRNRPRHKTKGDRPYKGVRKRNNRFVAEIRIDGKNISLGSFLTPEDAAFAYDCAAKQHFGEFANLNGVTGKPSPRALQKQAIAILEETGLTPQQLREQRDELLAALKIVERDRLNCNGRVLEMHAAIIRAAIASVEGDAA